MLARSLGVPFGMRQSGKAFLEPPVRWTQLSRALWIKVAIIPCNWNNVVWKRKGYFPFLRNRRE